MAYGQAYGGSYGVAGEGDATPPVVTEFAVPAAHDSLTVPITALTANEDATFIVSENGATPAADDVRWGDAPVSFTAGGEGLRTFYAWARDDTGNVSARAQATVTVTLPVEEPPPASGSVLKHAGGSAAKLKRWNGEAWVEVPLKLP
jgi:hypothetical protein